MKELVSLFVEVRWALYFPGGAFCETSSLAELTSIRLSVHSVVASKVVELLFLLPGYNTPRWEQSHFQAFKWEIPPFRFLLKYFLLSSFNSLIGNFFFPPLNKLAVWIISLLRYTWLKSMNLSWCSSRNQEQPGNKANCCTGSGGEDFPATIPNTCTHNSPGRCFTAV